MTAPDEKPRAVSPLPIPRPRGAFYEGGVCVHHDCVTEILGGAERCRQCVAEFDEALAVCDGARDRRRR